MTQAHQLLPAFGLDHTKSVLSPVRSPKSAELVARTLRRLIADGTLKEGDHLPTEATLRDQFAVSRATLREAVRLLESDQLVEVRRGARTGARVRLPGAEIVARPAGLLLHLCGATIADVMLARASIEPTAAKLLADQGPPGAIHELESVLPQDTTADISSGRLAERLTTFHRRLVELSGNATLSIIATTLNDILEKHASSAPRGRRSIADDDVADLLLPYRQLLVLLRAHDGDAAEAHWRRHINAAYESLPRAVYSLKVRGVID